MQINFTFSIVPLLCRLLKLNIIKTKTVKLGKLGFYNKNFIFFHLPLSKTNVFVLSVKKLWLIKDNYLNQERGC